MPLAASLRRSPGQALVTHPLAKRLHPWHGTAAVKPDRAPLGGNRVDPDSAGTESGGDAHASLRPGSLGRADEMQSALGTMEVFMKISLTRHQGGSCHAARSACAALRAGVVATLCEPPVVR